MTHRTLMGLTLTALVEGLVGCGLSGSPSTLPAPSPIPQRPAVHPTTSVSIISGFVLDTGFRPIVGARVEVVDGSQAGTFTTAGADGQFSLSGTFDAGSTFRASQDGYVAATQGWNCSTGLGTCPANGAKPWLGFYLDVLVAPVDITGNYTRPSSPIARAQISRASCARERMGRRLRRRSPATRSTRPSTSRSAARRSSEASGASVSESLATTSDSGSTVATTRLWWSKWHRTRISRSAAWRQRP